MKIATIIVRILLGGIFIVFSVLVLFNLVEAPPLTGTMKTFNDGLVASGYLMKLIKITELICGIALVTGFFAPLAAVVIFPISLNIFLVHVFVEPTGLPMGLFVLVANLFLAFAYRKHYTSLFKLKAIM